MDPYGDVFFFKSLPIREAYRIEQILCSLRTIVCTICTMYYVLRTLT